MNIQQQFTAEESATFEEMYAQAIPEQQGHMGKELARLKRNSERRATRQRQKAEERRAARQREKSRMLRDCMEALRRDPVYQEAKLEKKLARIKRNADRREARGRLKKKSEGAKVNEKELARIQRNAERREACHRVMKERR